MVLMVLSAYFPIAVYRMLKPILSEGVKLTELSNGIDHVWYEIRLTPLSSLPKKVKIGRVPGMAYFIGITLEAEDCDALARDLALRLNVRVSGSAGKWRDDQSIDSWVASYPPPGVLIGSKRSCTLYGRERNAIELSRFSTLTVEVSAEGAWQPFLRDAEIVLDGVE
jgi:hypothetical protein